MEVKFVHSSVEDGRIPAGAGGKGWWRSRGSMGGRGSNGYWDGKSRREKEQRIENLEAEFWGPELEMKPKKSKIEAGMKSKDKNK